MQQTNQNIGMIPRFPAMQDQREEVSEKGEDMDKLQELERRIDEYQEQTLAAEKAAFNQLKVYPQPTEPLTAQEILRREMFRHHTRVLLLNQVKEWIAELQEME